LFAGAEFAHEHAFAQGAGLVDEDVAYSGHLQRAAGGSGFQFEGGAGVADQGDVDLALLQGFYSHVVVDTAVAQDQSAAHGVALGAFEAAAPVAGVGLDDDG